MKYARFLVGLMSGTSMDAVDGVLAGVSADPAGDTRLHTLAFESVAFEVDLRRQLFDLQAPGPDEMARSHSAAIALSQRYAGVVERLLSNSAAPDRSAIRAVGAHGQTVRHRPELGYTVQLLNGSVLAELTRLPVVCDFRSADVAAGGQGAPLAPAFHQAVFGSPSLRRLVVNIGGIGNVTQLSADTAPIGFDTGPGNLLMDAWIERHHGHRYDAEGAWAAGHASDPTLLGRLLAEPYFAQPAPKSTGRDLFGLQWLMSHLRGDEDPGVVQSTLLDLTVTTIAQANRSFGADQVLVCGGGAHNTELMKRLGRLLAPARVSSTATLGIDPGTVEALAFAWLADRRLMGRFNNLPTVTGARHSVVMGALYSPPLESH